MENLKEKIERVLSEHLDVVDYNEKWPEMFEEEKKHLLECLPNELIKRIEHFGSTAVPGLCAKPIVDMLVEVTDLEETKKQIAPVLEAQGYDYFWRPMWSEDVPPYYAWFIKRDSEGKRTHHIHMVEKHFEHWERLLFRDYLREFPGIAQRYQNLKNYIAKQLPNDRLAYGNIKTDFIVATTMKARKYYGK